MKFLWLYKNNDHVKMASTALLSLDLALFSCSRFRSFKFIISHTLLLTCLGYVANALENETVNEAFWLHKLYALPEALLFKMPIKKKNTSWFVNRPRKCFLTFFPKRHFLCEYKGFQRLSKWAEKYSRRGGTPSQGTMKVCAAPKGMVSQPFWS